ncbi:MAG: bile acid:sodium symporter [Pirellulales bacterium]|nr:bile acid:sodium symporter [Pirellulales bacterium]
MLRLMHRHWFLLLLLGTLAIGMGWADRCAPLAKGLPSAWIIGSVLWAMALPLRMDHLVDTLRSPRPALLAVATSWLLVPLLAWCFGHLLIDDLALGLTITAAVPCTLASAAVWTRLAGGNDSVGFLVTVLTNLSCFCVTPALIQISSGRTVAAISFGPMALRLLALIVLPLGLAQLMRRMRSVRHWADQTRHLLNAYAQLGILAIVFVGAVHCGTTLGALASQWVQFGGQLAALLIIVATIHTIAWASGYWVAGRIGIARPEQIAVAFAGSQKTLMVGLVIALDFGGLTILPLITFHVVQLLIDTLLASRLRVGSEA